MKFKKYLLTVAGISSIALPITSISCGKTSEDGPIAKIQESKLLTTELASSNKIKAKNLKFALITDTGKVTDKSFNQSAWEALQLIEKQTSVDKKDEKTGKTKKEKLFEFKAIENQKGDYDQVYKEAVALGTNVLVLPGFSHKDHISTFIEENIKDLKDKNVIIIGIDFDLPNNKYENFYSLKFNINQASWQLGYALSKYLSAVYPNNQESRKLASLGGGPFFGVTDFITGYLKGIDAFNNDNPTLKTKHAHTIDLQAGFKTNDIQTASVTNMLNTGAKIVYPVAGPATLTAVDQISKNKNYKDKLVVGVDVDQSKALSSKKGYFATSVLKNIAQATYDIILSKVFEIKDIEDKIKLAKQGETNNFFAGVELGWVGLAESTIQDETKRKIMNDAISEAKQKFDQLTKEDKDFISSPKSKKDGEEVSDKEISKVVNELIGIVNK